MVCDMTITYAGNVKAYEFYPAVMKSAARLTYNQVWQWLENDEKYPRNLFRQPENALQIVPDFASQTPKRGAMEFETIETQMIFLTIKAKLNALNPSNAMMRTN